MKLELTKNQKVVLLKAMDLSIAELNRTINDYELDERHQGVVDLNNLYTAKRKLMDSMFVPAY